MQYTVLLVLFFFSTLAYPQDFYCPQPDDQHRYIETKTFPNEPSRPQKMGIFYFLTSPFNNSKPTLVYLNGGPGDYSMPGKAWMHDDYNVVYMHHRGVGCSKALGDIRPTYREPFNSIDHAAEDLDEVRKHLLGEDGRWFVYGISYGGILAQAYALKHADYIEGLVLDSTFYSANQITVARDQFFDLFFPAGDPITVNLNRLFTKYPDVRVEVLRIAVYSNSFLLRAIYFPRLVEDLINAPTQAHALAFLEQFKTPLYPRVGMAREITCREMWDFPDNDSREEYYLPGFTVDCLAFKEFRSPFDFSSQLSNLNVKTMIWGGKYDPVASLASMKHMNALIPGSLLLENQFAGHGIIREKPECAKRLLSLFHSSSTNSEITNVMASGICQSAPEVDDLKLSGGFKFNMSSF